jgi:hypothetical protein
MMSRANAPSPTHGRHPLLGRRCLQSEGCLHGCPDGVDVGVPSSVHPSRLRPPHGGHAVTVLLRHTQVEAVSASNKSERNVPGQVPFNPALNRRTGVTTNDILWTFFAEHPKRR